MDLRKFAIFSFLFFALIQIKAQDAYVRNKIVLLNDKVPIYNVWYPSTTFGHSYFICLQEFDIAFTDASFSNLESNLKAKNKDISAFKSADNKSVTCIFPKHTLSGIKNIQDFILVNLDSYLNGHLVQKQTVHIQVASEYDVKNKPEEKGFTGFN